MTTETPRVDAAVRMLELQRDVASTLAAIGARDEAARAILAACLRIDGIDSGGVYLVDRRTREVHLVAHAGLGAPFIERVSSFPPDAPQLRLVSDHVVFSRPYRDIAPTLDDIRLAEGLRGLAVVALRCDGELVGVINVASHVHEQLSEPSVAAIAAIAAVSGATLRRLAAEEAQRESERQYRALFETMTQGVLYQDAEGRVLAANPAFLRIFGITAEQAIGTTTDEVHVTVMRPDGHPMPTAEHPPMRALATRSAVRDVVVGVDPPGGGVRRWVLVNSIPEFRTPDASPYRVFSTVEDITERKHADDELLRTRDDMKRLALHLQTLVEEERKAVAREIHDELGQELTAMKLDLGWLEPRAGGLDGGFREKLDALSAGVDRMLADVRRLARRLRPAILDDLGLVPALRWLIDDFEARVGVRVHAQLPAELAPIDDRVAIALFRVVQEALTNVARHAHATRVDVDLRLVRGHLVVTVRDNGRGLHAASADHLESYGIVGMRERISNLGGTFTIGEAPGGGTTIRVEVPLAAPGRRRHADRAPRR